MKKIMCLILTVSLFLNCFVIGTYAKQLSESKLKYSDSTVLVMLTKEYSIPGSKFDVSFFDSDMFSEVEDLMNYNPNKKGSGGHKLESWYISLCLTLKEPGYDNVEKAIKYLKTHKAVKSVSKNYYGEVGASSYTIPNDTYYSSHQYGLEKIEAKRAWSITKGLSSVKIAVIDTGINRANTDLTTNTNTSLHRNFVSNTSSLFWHGTHVAGILGANTNNNMGVAGVCWNATLVDLRVSNTSSVSVSVVASAINYAAENDIPLINLSISFPTGSEDLKSAIRNYDGLIIACAGNDEGNTERYPAKYQLSNVLVVTSTGTTDLYYSGANYHSSSVHVAAPGVNVYSTKENGYGYGTGTSMATPYVTGIAALMLSVNPNLTPVQIKNIIIQTVDTNSSLLGKCSSGGRVNAFNAVMMAGGYILGDVDLDGTVSAADARLASNLSVDSITLPSLQVVMADYDGDGTVSAGDARAILRVSTGLSPYFIEEGEII